MNDVASLIKAFGGPTAFARAIGVQPSTASEMKRRKSIPVQRWPSVIAAAQARGIEIDSEALMCAHAPEAK